MINDIITKTIDENIEVYKEQIEIAKKRRHKEEVKIIMDDKSQYRDLAELNNFITELKKSLKWYEERKQFEGRKHYV